jgi:DNA modification methylase
MLGLNKIYNTDCLEGMKLLDDKSIDLILTDIPYSEVNRKSNGLRNLNKGIADILTFDLNIFLEECNRVCKGSIYMFCATEQVSLIRSEFVKFGLSTRHCIWEKSNPSPMNGEYIWLSSIENCIFAKNKNAAFNEHCKSSVWKFSNGRSKIHPTEKPLKLFEYLVKTSSNINSLVFDPCIVSETTIIACKNLNRNFIGFENNEQYYNIACQRLSNHAKENRHRIS